MLEQDKGGEEGIWVSKAGNVAETCMGNVAIVDQNDVLRSPHFDGTILAGTTILRAFAVAPQMVQVILEPWVGGFRMSTSIIYLEVCFLR